MAAGIDISAASGGGGALDPLIQALDQYSRMLQAVANSLDTIKFPEFPEISIKDELKEFLEKLGVVAKQKPYQQPKQSDIRYNPDLDVALGIASPEVEPVKLEPPKVPGIAPVKLEPPKVPELTAPPISVPEVPELEPIKLESPKVPELTAPPISVPQIPGLDPVKLEPPKVPELHIDAPKLETIEIPEIEPVKLELPEIEVPQNKLPDKPAKLPKPTESQQPAENKLAETSAEPEKAKPKSILGNDEIKSALGAFKGLGNVGNIASTVAKGLGGLAVAIDIVTKITEELFDLIESALEPLDDAIKAVGDALQPVANLISTALQTALKPFIFILQLIGKLLESVLFPFIAILKLIGKAMEAAFLPFVFVMKIVTKLLQLLSAPLEALDVIFEAVYEAMDALLVPIEALIELIEWLTGGIVAWIATMVKGQKAQKDSIKTVADYNKAFKDTIKNLLSDPLQFLPRIVSEIRDAVDLFNPGAMLDFDLAMRDLQAVFGEFLAPVVKQAALVVRAFADTLRPILLAAAPLFQKFVGAIGEQLIANIAIFAETLASAIPAITEYIKAQIYGAERQLLLMEKWRRADTLFKMIALPFETVFKNNKMLRADINQARKADGALEKKALPGAQGLAVAYNAGFKGIAELARESMLQAFIGTSSMANMKNAKRQQAEDNVANLKNVIKEAAKNAFVDALEAHDRRKPADRAVGIGAIFGGNK